MNQKKTLFAIEEKSFWLGVRGLEGLGKDLDSKVAFLFENQI